MKVHGVCKFLLLGTEPEFELYVTPVNIDPEKPAMPIGYPVRVSDLSGETAGPYATLGLAEDTWGLNEHVLDDDHFLQQCLDIDREREAMFFDGLDKVPRGLVRVRVRRHRPHAAHVLALSRRRASRAARRKFPCKHRNAIEDLYRRMDDLVGRTDGQVPGDGHAADGAFPTTASTRFAAASI